MSEEKNKDIKVMVDGEVAKVHAAPITSPLKSLTLVQKKILMTLIWMIKDTDGSEIKMDIADLANLVEDESLLVMVFDN